MMLYELHCHTSAGSWCGKISPEDQADCYRKMGYDGIFITEHFPVSAKFEIDDWGKKVDLIEESFRRAEARGKEIGLQVFFAFEYGYKGTDILTYGLGADWLRANPGIREMRVEEYMRLAHDAGGYLVHAHPFRAAHYIRAIRLVPWLTDAVEVINGHRTDFENAEARHYAEAFGLQMTVGSDNHTGYCTRMLGIETENRLNGAEDLIALLRSGAFSIRDFSPDPSLLA